MTKSLEAWVLHKQWSGDTSARVTFFTLEMGMVRCMCKGGRTPKKQSLLQPFTPLWLAMDERYEQYFVRSIESTMPAFDLKGMALFSGLYVNELLYYTLSADTPDAELFAAYATTLSGLASASNQAQVEALLRRFEWMLLYSCGYSFSLTEEAATNELISSELHYRFIAGEGFVLDNKGIPGHLILALADDDLSESDARRAAKQIMRKAIDHVLGGREIKARALFG